MPNNPKKLKGRWLKEEHDSFLRGIEMYGKNWDIIMGLYVPTRTITQIRTHAQKYFKKTDKGLPFPEEPYEATPDLSTTDRANLSGFSSSRSQSRRITPYHPGTPSSSSFEAESAATNNNYSATTASATVDANLSSDISADASYRIHSSEPQEAPASQNPESTPRGVGGTWPGGGGGSSVGVGQQLWPFGDGVMFDPNPSTGCAYGGGSPIRNWPALSFDFEMDEDDLMVAVGIEGDEPDDSGEFLMVPIDLPPVYPTPGIASWIGYSATPEG